MLASRIKSRMDSKSVSPAVGLLWEGYQGARCGRGGGGFGKVWRGEVRVVECIRIRWNEKRKTIFNQLPKGMK